MSQSTLYHKEKPKAEAFTSSLGSRFVYIMPPIPPMPADLIWVWYPRNLSQ